MKNNKGDEQVKGKMDKLDTLSGGIVFGKEEAWEKLQARMEAKPVKRIAIRYWVAAAAVLLVIVTVITMYNNKPADFVKNVTREIVPPVLSNATKIPQVASPVAAAQREPREENSAGTAKQKHVTNIVAVQNVPVVNNEVPEQHVLQTPVSNAEKLTITAPLATIRKPMGVVHINEIEQQNTQAAGMPAEQATSTASLKKMPVVNLADVVREENDVRKIRQENRFSVGYFLRLNDARMHMPENNDQRTLFKPKSNSDDSLPQVTDNDLSGYYVY